MVIPIEIINLDTRLYGEGRGNMLINAISGSKHKGFLIGNLNNPEDDDLFAETPAADQLVANAVETIHDHTFGADVSEVEQVETFFPQVEGGPKKVILGFIVRALRNDYISPVEDAA